MTIYEPRAFWDVLRADAIATSQSLQMNRNHFYNGTRWPITITKLGIAPVQYGYSTGVGSLGSGSRSVESLVAQGLSLQLSARQRYDFGNNQMSSGNITTKPTALPSGDLVPSGKFDVRQSSKYGAVHCKFDRTLSLPAKGAVEFTPSICAYPAGTPGVDYEYPTFGVAFHEVGGQLSFGGQARVKQRAELIAADISAPTGFAVYNGWVPQVPVNSQFAFIPPANAQSVPFPPSHVFTAKEFVTQDASVRPGQPSFYDGLTVMIDQLALDDYTIAIANGSASIANLANFVGVRARMTEGGTKEEWWRPGMPLSLACHDQTPALIHELPVPFTMEPGEQLEVFVNIPAAASVEVAETYSVAVAVLGFATIEGVTV